jgi:hypothetical protein
VVKKYLFLKWNSAPKIYDYTSVTLGDKHPSYSTVKNWVAGFGTGHPSTEDKECSGRPTQVAIPESMDAIHSTILDNQRIFLKKIAETLAISRKRVSDIIHEILDMRRLSANEFLNVSMLNRSGITSHFGPILAGSCGIF